MASRSASFIAAATSVMSAVTGSTLYSVAGVAMQAATMFSSLADMKLSMTALLEEVLAAHDYIQEIKTWVDKVPGATGRTTCLSKHLSYQHLKKVVEETEAFLRTNFFQSPRFLSHLDELRLQTDSTISQITGAGRPESLPEIVQQSLLESWTTLNLRLAPRVYRQDLAFLMIRVMETIKTFKSKFKTPCPPEERAASLTTIRASATKDKKSKKFIDLSSGGILMEKEDLQEMIRRIRAEGSRFTDTDVSSQSVPSPEKAHANPSKSVTYSARHPEAMRIRGQKKGSRSHGGKRSV